MNDTNQPVTGSGSNTKLIIIVVGVVVVLALLGYFMGFFNMGPGGITSPAYFAPGTDVDRNMDGSTTYTTEEGSVTVGGGSMPSNWPGDAPTAYSGAQILYSGDTNPTTGEAGSAVVYTTTASVESVVQYYESRLKAEGWNLEGTMNASGMTVISAKKGERTFGVYVASADGVTQVTVGVQGI